MGAGVFLEMFNLEDRETSVLTHWMSQSLKQSRISAVHCFLFSIGIFFMIYLLSFMIGVINYVTCPVAQEVSSY